MYLQRVNMVVIAPQKKSNLKVKTNHYLIKEIITISQMPPNYADVSLVFNQRLLEVFIAEYLISF